MIRVKKSYIRKREERERSELIKRFSALNITEISPSLSPIVVPTSTLATDKWIVPICTKTYYDSSDSSDPKESIPLQQTSVYSYFGREIIQVKLPEHIDLKLFLFERFGLSPDERYSIHYHNDLIFIYLYDPFSLPPQPAHNWNNMLSMFRLDQPDGTKYMNSYSAILHGYCNDPVYDQWYKQEITTQLKLQNSSETIPLRMIFELCEKLV